MKLEYKLKLMEHNGLKGIIGEHLARSYIRNKLALRLVKEERWNHVLFSKNDYKQHAWIWNTKLFSFDRFRDDFIVYGFYANRQLLTKYASVVSVFLRKHCTPDGLLLKLRETGKTKRLEENVCPSIAKLRATVSRRCMRTRKGDLLQFPVVCGDLEVVEIKCGRKAKLMRKQKETYNDLIAKGIPLRLIGVRFVSFDLNRFLVEERKIENFM